MIQGQEAALLFKVHPLILRQYLTAVFARGLSEGAAKAQVKGLHIPKSIIPRHFQDGLICGAQFQGGLPQADARQIIIKI